MSDINNNNSNGNKKRKLDEAETTEEGEVKSCDEQAATPVDENKVVQEEEAPDAWLRAFLTPLVADAPVRMDGPINWLKFWGADSMPHSHDELARFVGELLANHLERHYGSYELQLIFTALVLFHRHQTRLIQSVRHEVSSWTPQKGDTQADKKTTFCSHLVNCLEENVLVVPLRSPSKLASLPCHNWYREWNDPHYAGY
jgi:hypothetical protein